jgi:hypothetical protein
MTRFPHSRGRRRAAQLIAVACVAATLTLAPLPKVAIAREMVTHTEHVRLTSLAGDRSRDAIAAVDTVAEAGVDAKAALAAPGRRAVTRAAAGGFRAIGVTVLSAPSAPIYVRARAHGTWTPWLEAHFAPDHAPDIGTEHTAPGLHSDPVWMGDADAYEVDAPPGLAQVDVHLVADGPRHVRIVDGSGRAGAAATAPAIRSRSAWGARPPKQRLSITSDLKLAIVHHSVNANSYSAADVPALLRSMQAYHMDVNGWDDIAYNFAVDRFGQAWEARGGGVTNVVLGGHSQGFNSGTVGVVAIGDFRSAVPPSATIESISQVIAWKFAIHGVGPTSSVPFTTNGSAKYAAGTTIRLPRIVGHRDVQLTECPGAQLYSKLGTIRARVSQLVPAYQPLAATQLVVGDLNADGLSDPLEYHTGTTADVLWTPTKLGAFAKQSMSINSPYRPVVGDFDGDGRRDVMWHGTGSTPDSLWWNRATGIKAEVLNVTDSFIPLAGDFDGNGVDDIFWYGTGLAQDYAWYFSKGGGRTTVKFTQDLITALPVVGDFDGDARDDIVWHGPGSTATDTIWWSTGRSFLGQSRPVGGYYQPAALDADGDGNDELVFVQPGSTTSYRWSFDALRHLTSTTLSTAPLSGTPTVGDFDGDGRDDVLVFSPTGADQVWYSTATGIDARTVDIPGGYAVAAGKLDGFVGAAADDLLLVSPSASDYVWQGKAGRTFTQQQVG